jgi:hypothetical protein
MKKRNGCIPFKFSVGDKVRTIRGKIGRITAIGGFYAEDRFISPVFRVGKKSYWYEWQISRVNA